MELLINVIFLSMAEHHEFQSSYSILEGGSLSSSVMWFKFCGLVGHTGWSKDIRGFCLVGESPSVPCLGCYPRCYHTMFEIAPERVEA